ncbi:class I adenylate-forming enzyme family protein [Streptomyces showdoensis]|uniref:Pentalenene synthase n=1 Tax=Streptomyces showdoensis TaxID=68268 RepID=A0A2P2GNZ8_STREW|nr:class I adenylate-forming enzyme family protein [Streptomyces showdoensis]KKZ73230.1 pentalenene synthase [Streptomyces showdoensis]
MTVALHDLLPARLRRSWAVEGLCPDLDLYSLFRARQIADPHRTAVIDAKGALCYTALDRKVRCLAEGLRSLGIGAGDVVGVQLPDGRGAVTADLALAALGAVALPFPVGRGAQEAEGLLRGAEAVAVIAATEHRGRTRAAGLLALAPTLPALRHVIAAGPGTAPEGTIPLARLLRTDPTGFVPARPDPDGAARILVSSGSEAAPKMVAYSHNALAGGRGNFLASLMPDTTPPRCLFLVPLASAFGSSGTAVTLARHGGTLVLLDHFTPEAALAAVRAHAPTHVLGVPTMIRMMLERLELEGPGSGTLPAPTALVLGGAPLDEATATAATEGFGCPVVNLYGSADGVNCHTGIEVRPEPTDPAAPAPAASLGIVVGRPDPRVADIRIADPDTHQPLPGGRIGEIVSRGPMTPLCYVAAPELDARYRTPEGWVRTGDLGYLDADGLLHVVGRLKDVVIRGGANISPAEVERELAAHPRIRDVVCVGVPDPLMGERLAACVVVRGSGPAPGLPELGAHLDARGLDRHKHPELLLLLDALPLTAAGKPDRGALRRRAALAPVPAEA